MKECICNCIALYGEKNFCVDLKKWYFYIKQWLVEGGYSIDSIGIKGHGFSGKAENFDKISSKLEGSKFTGIKSIEVYSEPRGKKQTVFNWRITADINLDQGLMVICFDNSLFSNDTSTIEKIISSLIRISDIAYGIYYQRNIDKGPAFYAYGMTTGLGYSDQEMNEADKIAKWMYLESNVRKNFLRDIYRINILSQKHLEKQVYNTTLIDWIKETDSRGSIEQINKKLWIWKVGSDSIDQIKKELGEIGILACYNKE